MISPASKLSPCWCCSPLNGYKLLQYDPDISGVTCHTGGGDGPPLLGEETQLSESPQSCWSEVRTRQSLVARVEEKSGKSWVKLVDRLSSCCCWDCCRDRTAVRTALAAPLLCAPLRSSACQRRLKATRAAAGCAQQDGAAAENGRAWLQNKSTKASKVGKQALLERVNCAEGERELRLKHLVKK